MSANQAHFPVATMARVLGVAPSGYYAWRGRAPSAQVRSDAALKERIGTIHNASRGIYGAPRIHAELRAGGVRVSRKRVARLMRAMGLAGVSRRKGVRTTRRDPHARPAPGSRRAVTSRPRPPTGCGWPTSPTCRYLGGVFVYLAVVLDVFSRRVVGWAMGHHLHTTLILGALNMAASQRTAAGVIHHSDQGSQYTSLAFGKRCQALGVRPSMGSVGDCYDNAMAESFFATLECELLERSRFTTLSEARLAIFAFIEGFYNTRRRHSALGHQSPIEFERRYQPSP